ncbi:MerR family transcriptional regulator [Streptomyces sp. NPDC006879]|uniref:helix-turn-helix domain-containing protein n=1 Tax=Streptomyces sp. NPDC006879 TaxID=3364767 RepID=UPI00368D4C39
MFSETVLWTIGELSERAGVTVKTVRFYSDRGLLPSAARSAGGHRRYGPESLARLRTIRSLRNLDLSVEQVARILDRDDSLEDVISLQLRALEQQKAALKWREAALNLLQGCSVEERAERLQLIGSLGSPPSTEPMIRFWRRLLPLRLPSRLVSSITEAAVPQPPADPSPSQVLAFARLHALTSGVCSTGGGCRSASRLPAKGTNAAVLYDGLREAYALAAVELSAERAPAGGEALDCFVAAHASSAGDRDTSVFRRQLSYLLARTADPVMDRYWRLTAQLSPAAASGREPTLGASHAWLREALDAQTSAAVG